MKKTHFANFFSVFGVFMHVWFSNIWVRQCFYPPYVYLFSCCRVYMELIDIPDVYPDGFTEPPPYWNGEDDDWDDDY